MKTTHKLLSLMLGCVLAFSCISVLPASAAETDSSDGDLPVCFNDAFLFHNTLHWDNVFMFAWSEQGEFTGNWPGEQLSAIGKDDFDCDIYSITPPYGASYIIIGDGNDRQTDVITDFDPVGGGYYLDPDQMFSDGLGFVGYTPLRYDELVFSYSIGDTDNNKIIDINDVTAIQKYLAQLTLPDTFNVYAADVDQSTVVNINDATLIQCFLAEIERSESYCNASRTREPSGFGYVVDFSDLLNWGKVTLIARDKNGRYLPNAFVKEEYSYGPYTVGIPEETASLTVVSEDGDKRTVPCTDPWYWGGFYPTLYVAWDKPNSQYVLDSRHSGGLIPEVNFINSLHWKHVCMIEWDRFGNVIGTVELESTNNRYTGSPAFNATKVAFTDGDGAVTDYITGFYAVPGEGDTYRLDQTQTTVNDEGKTVYIPIKCSDEDEFVFTFTNSLGWSDISVCAWGEYGEMYTDEWPGNKLKDPEIDASGNEVYTVTLPAGAVGAIISCDTGMTAEINDFYPAGGGYYLDSNKTTQDPFGNEVYTPLALSTE